MYKTPEFFLYHPRTRSKGFLSKRQHLYTSFEIIIQVRIKVFWCSSPALTAESVVVPVGRYLHQDKALVGQQLLLWVPYLRNQQKQEGLKVALRLPPSTYLLKLDKARNRPDVDVIPDFSAFCLLAASSVMRTTVGTF